MSKVLIATDGSDCAIGAARTAMSLFAPGSDLTVLSVVDVRAEVAVGGTGLLGAEPLAMPMADPTVAAELDEALTEGARDAVQRTVAALGERGVQPQVLVAHGDPATEIVRVAEDGNYDVVVVGSHGAGFLKRVLVGSVSNHVVHHATCPVLVVRVAGDA
jgi:nucleotide-binding universal stress UspA family protein